MLKKGDFSWETVAGIIIVLVILLIILVLMGMFNDRTHSFLEIFQRSFR